MAAFVPALSLAARPTLSRSALCGAAVSAAVAPAPSAVSMSDLSPSVPFLPKPKNLSEDMVGYTGFDPLGLSNLVDIKWLQESEIKHGRVCMLAVAGILAQEFVHLPDPRYANPLATEALNQVPSAALWQIFLFCGLAEFVLHKGKISYVDMFSDGAVPGELGFNPMNLKISDDMKLKEIKNGRLAMCAVGGFIHSMFIYKTPIIAQLLDFKPYPLNL
uniref:Light-harvest protein n=1 Tax=Griffithsia japonica TaxID=83288 RepID=Q7X8N6_GRIJA|nr:light-harvest protein [Griffithsia japonica]AAP80722.1 light-harvest protein [Griffithsia japonica]